MRLLLVSQPVSGGVAACVQNLAEYAQARGIEVKVACPGGPQSALALGMADAGIEHVAIPMQRAPAPSDLSALWMLRRLFTQFDVVHLHSSKAGALGRIASSTLPRHRRPRLLFTPHAWSWLVGGRLSSVYRAIERVLAGSVDHIIAVSESEAEEGRQILSSGSPIVTIPNGVDTARLTPTGPVAERSSDPLLVCVGRLARQKGQDIAIEALSYLPETVRLRLVGDGPLRGELERLAHALSVEDRVEWVGDLNDPAPHLRAADLVLIPSRWDGLSLVLLEAMSVGSAIVATTVSGTEAAEGVAELVPEADAIALGGACERLLATPSRLKEMRSASRRRAESYDVSQMLESNFGLWESLFESGDESRTHERGE